MPQKLGTSRSQIQFFCLEEVIGQDHPVRVIDAFVAMMDLETLGFHIKGKSNEGRPAYDTAMLLKLYLYGYQNSIRSSRKLQAACCHNVELWWLLGQQRPKYKTIADFRKVHGSALQQVFRQFVLLCRDWSLVAGQTIAIDGSKFRAQNSRKNNFSDKKITRHLAYIDEKIASYLQEIDQADEQENKEEAQASDTQQLLQQLQQRRKEYKALQEKLDQAKKQGQQQISVTDPDARAMPVHHGVVEIGYNVQSAVDSKHNLVVHAQVTNQLDTYALSEIAIETKEILLVDQMDILADKGYHTGSELKKCADENIITYVAPLASSQNKRKDPAFRKDKFVYQPKNDTYSCPAGVTLTTNGSWYQKRKNAKSGQSYRFKHYLAPLAACAACQFLSKCTTVTNYHGRYIERTEYDDVIEANKQRIQANKNYYRQRQAIVEHPFGTIKRSLGYTYTLLRTKPKVSGEFALIFTCYNLKRVINILGVKELVRKLKGLPFLFSPLTIRNLVSIDEIYFKVVKKTLPNSKNSKLSWKLSFCTV